MLWFCCGFAPLMVSVDRFWLWFCRDFIVIGYGFVVVLLRSTICGYELLIIDLDSPIFIAMGIFLIVSCPHIYT